ncbi:hypothetical protein ANTPLA_LOCUS9666 [Anthophora plagiata]
MPLAAVNVDRMLRLLSQGDNKRFELTSVSHVTQELRKMNCHLTGTIRTSRKGVPTTLKKPKFYEKRSITFKKGNIMLFAWRDKRIVSFLSNWNNAGMTTTERFIRGGAEEYIIYYIVFNIIYNIYSCYFILYLYIYIIFYIFLLYHDNNLRNIVRISNISFKM